MTLAVLLNYLVLRGGSLINGVNASKCQDFHISLINMTIGFQGFSSSFFLDLLQLIFEDCGRACASVWLVLALALIFDGIGAKKW